MATRQEQEAEELHQRARELDAPEQALAMYHRVLELDANRTTTLYNIRLIHKYRGEWQLSREFNQRSVHLSPEDVAANWNMAIAATALRDWATARAVWRRLGILARDGEGPIDEDFGKTPVRLNPDGAGEVVWGDRIDPVRVRVLNVPYPESGFRYGDSCCTTAPRLAARSRGPRVSRSTSLSSSRLRTSRPITLKFESNSTGTPKS